MPSTVLAQEGEVIPELISMHLPVDIMMDIYDKAMGDRSTVNQLDPVETGGTEMRRWMTRYLREDSRLKGLGWELCRHGQIEGIKNDGLKLKLAFTNTDARTGVPSKQPSNIAIKGAHTESLANRNRMADQFSLAGLTAEKPNDPVADYDFWYFCGYVGEEYVSAEISRPDKVVSGFIRNFSKRILICQPGERPGLRKHSPVPEDFAEIVQQNISRKL